MLEAQLLLLMRLMGCFKCPSCHVKGASLELQFDNVFFANFRRFFSAMVAIFIFIHTHFLSFKCSLGVAEGDVRSDLCESLVYGFSS